MKEFDHLQVELSGMNLIEASAGTGKTYAIACLYLRLLIEYGLTPEQILVVTYTEAATEELRSRIRDRVREALNVFAGKPTDDDFLRGLVCNDNGKGPNRNTSRDNLDNALKSFDTASIFTIHGFCLRALQDNAFDNGSLFNTELVTDQSTLLQEIVDDFWRIRFFAESAPLLGYARDNKFSPEYLIKFLKRMVSTPELKVVPHFSPDEITDIEMECRASYDVMRKAWHNKKTEIVDILQNDKGLSRAAETYRVDCLPDLFEKMDSFVDNDNPFALFPDFCKFRSSGIAKRKKPSGLAPVHEFFDLCEILAGRVAERFLALKWELVVFAREYLPRRKREINIRFFDDLLNDLYDALRGKSGGCFSETLRNNYRAALIDEFQDTDPVQFHIFRKIFANADVPLFLIGDPKQAIYSFRGADIFAYMEAAATVEEQKRYTLTTNWRSTPRLLDAFNGIFSVGANPFIFSDITYHPVKQGKKENGKQLLLRDGDNAPLQVWYVPPDNNGTPPSIGRANETIPPAVASEIARLLQSGRNGKALIGECPLLPGDIAVIVRSHRQAGYIQDALRDLAIPSVMRSDRSIFATHEAREVLIILNALADPGSEPKVRAALVTNMFGMSGNHIAHLLEDEQAWEEWLEKFRSYHQEWLDRGFMVMSQSLLAREGVRGRLLCRPDGERRLTNVLHCFEVIHHASRERDLGIEGLLTWFAEQDKKKETAEEFQIRLETDEDAVNIVTAHVSKGLEYPIVFCPFMWSGIKSDDKIASFHDRFVMVKDFGSPDFARHQDIAQKESLAESLRLFYVALTRAQFRCYLLAGKITDKTRRNRPETSPVSYLFHAPEEIKACDDLVVQLADKVADISQQDIEAQLQTLAARRKGAITVAPMPEPGDTFAHSLDQEDRMPLACNKFTGSINSDWRVASFTSFAVHEMTTTELPDRDESGTRERPSVSAVLTEKPNEMTIFTFPRGSQAGIFFHEIFERLDFAGYSADVVNPLVEKGLIKYGYNKEWLSHVSTMVDNVVSTPLASPNGIFCLADLQPGCWITELEFFFPLRFITSDVVRDYFRKWCTSYGAADLLQLCSVLSFKPVRGMVRGFMDMVFLHDNRYYLVDWKSNHLGYHFEDYGRQALKEEMVENLYPLQYLLYTVALNSYLSLRVKGYTYESQFGGVLYVFLRGVSPERGEECGFFRDKPPEIMINELTNCLIQSGG